MISHVMQTDTLFSPDAVARPGLHVFRAFTQDDNGFAASRIIMPAVYTICANYA